MLLADLNLIPSYDMLGLPMPAWLAQSLMALTLALHWTFLSMAAGGAVAYVLFRRDSPGVPGPRRRALAAFLPLSLQTAMTLGIAPLLFVQVLYGQFFYTANILMGWVWLGLLVLMIVNFYMLYYAWHRTRTGRTAWLLGIAVLAHMAISAKILTANATLTQSPDAWDGFRAMGGLVPFMGDALFWPRWTMALSALLGGGGLFVAIFLRARAGDSTDAVRPPVGKALAVSHVGLAGAIAAGLWAAVRLPQAARAALPGGAEAALPYAALGAAALTLLLTLLARRSGSLAALLAPAGTFLVALLAVAGLRDAVRRAALAEHFRLASVPVHAQWSSFSLFAVILVLGLALMAYLVRLGFAPVPERA